MSPQLYEYIQELEEEKRIDPNCKMCVEIFYPELIAGKKLHEIFAPRHKALETCRSGKYPHCTCDVCF
jgi:hypothetical protein